ncbi:MAG: hypothetical protein E6767_13725 [Dysgonomonas sp.]|nr:hypothetical protein [Dysgonomonas sp.]
MKIRMINLIALFFLLSVSADAQYVISDKDGYTNVRERPDVNSPIIGRILNDQLFYNAYDVCEFDMKDASGNDIEETEKWLPVLIRQHPLVGYIYKKNVRQISLCPAITPHRTGAMTALFDDNNLKITITLQSIIDSEFVIRKNSHSHTLRVGQHKPYFSYDGNTVIKEMLIEWKNQKRKISEVYFYDLFLYENLLENLDSFGNGEWSPIQLRKGDHNTYYLLIHGGDGSESYSVTFIIKDGRIITRSLFEICEPPAVILTNDEDI